MMKRRAVFIGKWRVPHYGHIWLHKQKLMRGIPISIMIRDIPPTDNDPLTSEEIKEIWEDVYEEEVLAGMVEVTIIPDIESVNYGRGVGYEVNEFKPPEDIKIISATETRRMIKEGKEEWKENIPNSAWDKLIEAFSR